MTPLTRRTTLRGLAGSGAATVLAGCLDGNGATETPDDDGTDDGNDDDGTDDEPTIELRSVEPNLSGGDWSYRERRGICVLIRARRDGAWLFNDADAATTEFFEATDFEESVLVYVESVGPNTCYRELELDDVAVEDGRIVGSAVAVDASGADEDVCGPSLTYPGALVRVTTHPLPTDARFTVTDGWGEMGEVTPADGVLDPNDLPGFVRPQGDPDPVPAALECPDPDVERHYQGHDGDVSWGSAPGIDGTDGLALRVVAPEANDAEDGDGGDSPSMIGPGESFRVELTNVSTSVVGRGNAGKYNLERYTEDGWTELRVRDGEGPPIEYTDELLFHRPGETLTWEFEMTAEGLIEDGRHDDRLRVCPDPEPGRYRFVFWGVDDLAVAFDHEA